AGIATSIMAGVAGMVSGGFATAALILLLTGVGAVMLPFLKKMAIIVGKIGFGLTLFGVVLTILTAVLQKIGALDDASRMTGVLKSAQSAETNAEDLLATSTEADEHEAGTIEEMLAALEERGESPDPALPFSVMRAHGEAQQQAESAAGIAEGLGESLSEEDTPLQAAIIAHEGSARHIDMVLKVAKEKQLVLREQHGTLADVSQRVGAVGYDIKKVLSILSLFNPLLGLLTSPLIKETSEGKGPLSVINLFGLMIPN